MLLDILSSQSDARTFGYFLSGTRMAAARLGDLRVVRLQLPVSLRAHSLTYSPKRIR